MTNQIDPVKSLVDYTLEIKPYHSKIIEVLVDYLHTDLIGVTIIDKLDFKMLLDMDYSLNYCPDAGYGVLQYGDYYRVGNQIILNVLSVNVMANTFQVAGDLRHFFNVGNSPTIEHSTFHINGSWIITDMVYDPVSHITTITVEHLLNNTPDGSIISPSSNSYPIRRVDTVNNLLVVESNVVNDFSIGNIISVEGSSGNDGNWIVTSKFYHLLENTSVFGVIFNSITTPVGTAVDGLGNYTVDGYFGSYAQSNFDLPEECPYVAPNTARTIFTEDLQFEQGSTLYFRDFINVDVLEPSGIVSWSGGHYGWDVAGYNTEWPSLITLTDRINDPITTTITDSVVVDNIFVTTPAGYGLTSNALQSSITDQLSLSLGDVYLRDTLAVTITDPVGGISWNDSHYGWDETPWDEAEGVYWDFGAANTNWRPPFISITQQTNAASNIAASVIVDNLQVQGNFAGAFDYQAFDVGPFDAA